MTPKARSALEILTICVLLMATVMIFVICRSAKGSTADEFQFWLMLSETAVQSEASDSVVQWGDYRKQAKAGWPGDTIVYVSGPKCRACEFVKRRIFGDPEIAEAMNEAMNRDNFQWVQSAPEHWKVWSGKEKMGLPFLVVIRDGIVLGRAECPTSKWEFSNLLKGKRYMTMKVIRKKEETK